MRVFGFKIKRAEKRMVVEQGNGISWLTDIWQLFAGPKSAAGVSITEHKAMTIPAVFTAVRIISGTIASLPLFVYRRVESGGREAAVRHWAYPLLHDSPNEFHTSFMWRVLLLAHLMLWGNSYHRIEWLRNGSATAIYPLMPWDVDVLLTSRGEKRYRVRLPDGAEELKDDEVLHFVGPWCLNHLKGVSIVEMMRDPLGLSKASENLASAFFSRGAKPGWNLQVPGRMSAEAQKNLALSIQERFAKDDAMGVFVTEEGAKLIGPLTMPFKDAQFLETRNASRAEIFGWYGVPPHLAGDAAKNTTWGTGIEQMDIGYAKHTIHPLCFGIEQELNRKLFGRGSGLYCEFDLNGLMRGDFRSRIEALVRMTGRPFLTGNEARDLEGFNRVAQPDMDKVALQLNTGTGESAGDAVDADADATEPEGDEGE